jgi:hypothetical protein
MTLLIAQEIVGSLFEKNYGGAGYTRKSAKRVKKLKKYQ